jgi:hypothetical protein
MSWHYLIERATGAEPSPPLSDQQMRDLALTGKVKKSTGVLHRIHTGGEWIDAKDSPQVMAWIDEPRRQKEEAALAERKRKAEQAAIAHQEKAAAQTRQVAVSAPAAATMPTPSPRREPTSFKTWLVRTAIGLALIALLQLVIYPLTLSVVRSTGKPGPIAHSPAENVIPSVPAGPSKGELLAKYKTEFAKWLRSSYEKESGEKLVGENENLDALAKQYAFAFYHAHEETNKFLPQARQPLVTLLDGLLDFQAEAIPVQPLRGTVMDNGVPICFGSQGEKDQFLKTSRILSKYGRHMIEIIDAKDVVILRPVDYSDIAVGQTRQLSKPFEILHAEGDMLRVVRLPSKQDLALIGPSDLPRSGVYSPPNSANQYAIVRYEDRTLNVRLADGKEAKLPVASIVEVTPLVYAGALYCGVMVLDGVPVDEWEAKGFDANSTLDHLLILVKNDKDFK